MILFLDEYIRDGLFGLSYICRLGGKHTFQQVIKSFLFINEEVFPEKREKHPIIWTNKDLTAIKILYKNLEYNFHDLLKALDIYLKTIIRFKMSLNKDCINITTFLIQRFYKIVNENDYTSPNFIKLTNMFQ